MANSWGSRLRRGASLPVGRQVEGLKGLQVKQTELQNQYQRERLELERKYLSLQKPLYARRHAFISESAEATQDEIAAGEAAGLKEDEEYEPIRKLREDEEEGEAKPAKDVKGIPTFWVTALRNHPGLAEIVTERDAEALGYLKDVTLEYLEKEGGPYAGSPASPSPSPRPFFTNETLTKTYIYNEEVGYAGDFTYDRAIGSPITWKEEQDLTREWEIKKQRNKNTNHTRLIRKSHPTPSFFNFFSPPVMPDEEALESGELEREDSEINYQVGWAVKEVVCRVQKRILTDRNPINLN
ncbi:hypothetical protein B0H16DRAFT_1607538 [Mycena metata]|uniref:Nucleosome assembly protein n=1 Tax=Mycena metata TaxID=1033252 RepID=A0AAD7MJ31_9AGAR|nr:hypothetical protein B0H16DRAFT_1607538 [Mycena metata]